MPLVASGSWSSSRGIQPLNSTRPATPELAAQSAQPSLIRALTAHDEAPVGKSRDRPDRQGDSLPRQQPSGEQRHGGTAVLAGRRWRRRLEHDMREDLYLVLEAIWYPRLRLGIVDEDQGSLLPGGRDERVGNFPDRACAGPRELVQEPLEPDDPGVEARGNAAAHRPEDERWADQATHRPEPVVGHRDVPYEIEWIRAVKPLGLPKCGELPEEVVETDTALSALPEARPLRKIDVFERQVVRLGCFRRERM